MPIQFSCPNGHALKVGSKKSGQFVACPVCKQAVKVPPASPLTDEQTMVAGERTLATVASPRATTPAAPPRLPPKALVQLPTPAAPRLAPAPPKLDNGKLAAGTGHLPVVYDDEPLPSPPPRREGPSPQIPKPSGPRILRGYRADQGKRQSVYYLAGSLAVLSIFTMLPMFIGSHLGLGQAHTWARMLLFLSLLQLAYAAWMASLPDWSTVWTTMLFLATVATLYGMAMAVVLNKPDLLEIELHAARRAASWCGMVIMLLLLMTYLCGRNAHRWRRQFELARGKR